jgi:plasmid segregation protein ParM
MQTIGIDVGFGFTKATDGKQTIVFKSIYGDATEIQFWVDFQDRNLTEYFHVTMDGKSYFVGDLAEQQSDAVSFTLDQDRMIADLRPSLRPDGGRAFSQQKSSRRGTPADRIRAARGFLQTIS